MAVTQRRLLLLALLLASPTVARAAQAAEGTATVPRFEPAPCPTLPGAEELAKASCGYLVVPENRSQPTGRTIRLLVAKYPASSPEKRPDPVVYLAGGPGDILPLEVNGLIAADFIRDRDISGDEPARHHVLGAGADLRCRGRLRQRASWPPLLFRGNQARAFGGDRSLPPRVRCGRCRPQRLQFDRERGGFRRSSQSARHGMWNVYATSYGSSLRKLSCAITPRASAASSSIRSCRRPTTSPKTGKRARRLRKHLPSLRGATGLQRRPSASRRKPSPDWSTSSRPSR